MKGCSVLTIIFALTSHGFAALAQEIESYRTLRNCPFRTLADVDQDGRLEVVELVGTSANVYHLRDHAPDPLPGWPRHVPNDRGRTFYRSRPTPAAGDVRPGRPGLEVAVISTADEQFPVHDRLFTTLFGADGTRLFQVSRGAAVGYAVALADLDGDRNDEIIVGGELADHGGVLVYEDDGSLVPGWPWLQGRSDSFIESANLAIGNLRGDDLPEIVFGTRRSRGGPGESSFVYVLGRNGDLLGQWRTPDGEDIVHRIALANMDDDPYQEILILTTRYSLGIGVLHAINSDGTEVFNSGPLSTSTWGPVVADLDGDTHPETVVTSSYPSELRVFDRQGVVKVKIDGFAGEPSLADLNGDGVIDILLSYPGSPKKELRFHSLPWNGDVEPSGWPVNPPRLNRYSYHEQACIGDVDGDGMLEVLHANIVVELETLAEDAILPWPMYMRDARHTGSVP